MSKNKIILRVQSPDGTKRLEVTGSTTILDIYKQVQALFELSDNSFVIYKERNLYNELVSTRTKIISDYSIKHGDMLYMAYLKAGTSKTNVAPSTSNSTVSLPTVQNQAASTSKIIEEDIDILLSKVDGTIQRNRDNKLCRHNSNGCCVHCSPIEPWDENYLKEQKIKHLSFHSYIRKLTSGVDRGKFVALEDMNCKIKTGCRDHPPWPKGICSKCQPSALTLNRQTYRHVDNIMLENTAIVEKFLNYWRTCGHQRLGFLYGKYERHSDVPLGIRAVVSAIYEPPQNSSRDSIKLLEDEHAQEVDELAAALGLKKIGWIFTDLISEDPASGTVKHIRGIETHFLTAQECILAGQLQNQHPNISKYSSNGFFGSKFVTICVTGDEKKQVHMEGYAVSAQCMALVRDDCLIPTKDAPELGYIRESSDKQYVPDVYYKEKDIYGNEVSRLARPLPVEYLLVDIPASSPLEPIATFTTRPDRDSFPIENRLLDGHLQDFHVLSEYLSKWKQSEFLEAVSDFHLLIYLSRMEVFPMKASLAPLLQAIRTRDQEAAFQWKAQEVWSTLEQLITASDGEQVQIEAKWDCNHCTFSNSRQDQTCAMCNLPRT